MTRNLGIVAGGDIDDAVNEAGFGEGAETDARGFGAVIAGAVGFGAGDEDFIGVAGLGFGAMVPAFVGAAGELVLIDDDFERWVREKGGEIADAAFVGSLSWLSYEDFDHGRSGFEFIVAFGTAGLEARLNTIICIIGDWRAVPKSGPCAGSGRPGVPLNHFRALSGSISGRSLCRTER